MADHAKIPDRLLLFNNTPGRRLKRNEFYDPMWLSQVFTYDPRTGLICHRERTPEVIAMYTGCSAQDAIIIAQMYNARWPGQEALTSVCSVRGVRYGKLGKRRIMAARVAWAMGYNGYHPIPGTLGYRNDDPKDLRLDNLCNARQPDVWFDQEPEDEEIPESTLNLDNVNTDEMDMV